MRRSRGVVHDQLRTVGGGGQEFQEVEGSTTKFHLQSSFNGGAAEESSLLTFDSATLPAGETARLTCL